MWEKLEHEVAFPCSIMSSSSLPCQFPAPSAAACYSLLLPPCCFFCRSLCRPPRPRARAATAALLDGRAGADAVAAGRTTGLMRVTGIGYKVEMRLSSCSTRCWDLWGEADVSTPKGMAGVRDKNGGTYQWDDRSHASLPLREAGKGQQGTGCPSVFCRVCPSRCVEWWKSCLCGGCGLPGETRGGDGMMTLGCTTTTRCLSLCPFHTFIFSHAHPTQAAPSAKPSRHGSGTLDHAAVAGHGTCEH